MVKKKKQSKAAKNFGEMFKELGDAMAEIFDDPRLKRDARNFGTSAIKSARTFAGRFKDKDVKVKFSKAGKAAHKFGKEMEKIAKETGKKVEKSMKSRKKKK